MIGLVYDSLTGAYILTSGDVRIDPDLYNDCLMMISNVDSLASLDRRLALAGIPKYSGRALFSSLLPEDFYYQKGQVVIIDGILRNGTINKEHVGPSHGSIIQALYKDYGSNRVVDFLTDAPFIINRWLQQRGFSVGLQDCYLDGNGVSDAIRQKAEEESGYNVVLEMERNIDRIMEQQRSLPILKRDLLSTTDPILLSRIEEKINQIEREQTYLPQLQEELQIAFSQIDMDAIARYQTQISGEIKKGKELDQKILHEEITKAKMAVEALGTRLEDPMEEERRERQVIGHVNIAKSVGERVSKSALAPTNALNIMTLSGTKGSFNNISQITTGLFQQFESGQRMPMTISNGSRCLPYFEKDSLDPEARGFCPSSFRSGLSPAELFFHQAGGREGLMDTAIKTSETGSIHHRIIKALEDIKVAQDGSVRNTVGTVFQLAYGNDGFDAADLEKVKLSDDVSLPSFIDLNRVAGRLNAKYGYVDFKLPTEDVIGVSEAPEVDPERLGDIEFDYEDFDE